MTSFSLSLSLPLARELFAHLAAQKARREQLAAQKGQEARKKEERKKGSAFCAASCSNSSRGPRKRPRELSRPILLKRGAYESCTVFSVPDSPLRPPAAVGSYFLALLLKTPTVNLNLELLSNNVMNDIIEGGDMTSVSVSLSLFDVEVLAALPQEKKGRHLKLAVLEALEEAVKKEERKITAEHEKERRKKPKKVETGNMAMTREEADRNAEELLEELAREEKLLTVKKERRKELKKLKKMAGIEEKESGIEEWEAGIEDREAGIEERAGMGAREAGMFLINQRLGLDRAAAGKAGGGQKSQAWEEQVLAPSSENDASECCVCLANKKSWIFIPCGHVCVCRGCAEDIMQSSRQCPLCCQKAIGIFQVFL